MNINKINVILFFSRARHLLHSETSTYASVFYNAALWMYNTGWRWSLNEFYSCSTVIVFMFGVFFWGGVGWRFLFAWICWFNYLFFLPLRDFNSMGNFVLKKNQMLAFFWQIRKSCIRTAPGQVEIELSSALWPMFLLISTYVLLVNPLGWRALFLSPSNHRCSPVLNKAPDFKGNVIKPPTRNKYQSWTR